MSKLILTNEVSGLGSAGDVVEVKNGYARNYLIPQGFAVAWSKGGEKQVEQIKSARAARELATLEEAQALKAKLEGATVKLSVKSGSEGRLFGSVKTADVVRLPVSARSTSARSSSRLRSRRSARTRQPCDSVKTWSPPSASRLFRPSSSRTRTAHSLVECAVRVFGRGSPICTQERAKMAKSQPEL